MWECVRQKSIFADQEGERMGNRKRLNANQDIFLLILGIAWANLIFFHQENWKMDPWKVGIIGLGIYFCIKWLGARREVLKDSRMRAGSIFFGLLFAAMVVVGEKIHAGDWEFQMFSAGDIVWLIVYFGTGMLLFLTLSTFFFDGRMRNLMERTGKDEKGGTCRKGNWLLYSIVFMLFWTPVLFIYYPGIVPEDTTVSIAMVLGDLPWDNHFPVFYSLLAGGSVWLGRALGNPNLGVLLYSLLQLVSMAFLLGYFLEWMQRRIHRFCTYFALAFFCTIPVFGNYAIVMWKDPWYSGLLLLLGMFLYDKAVLDREAFLKRKNLVLYGVLGVLISLMRNNGIYIMILISVVLVYMYRKRVKRVALTCAVTILCICTITGPVYKGVFSAENEFVESIGIPLQQMVRVVIKDGNMTKEDKEFLNHLMPMEKYQEYYNPFLVDPVKWAPEFHTDYLNAHKAAFFQTWFSLLKSNFGIYVEQYLMGTYGFWHIGGDTPYEFVKTQIAANDWWLYQIAPFESYFNYAMQEKMSGKYDFMASGLLVWIAFYDVLLCWVKRKSRYILPLLIMVGNWLTLMIATPTAFGLRYIFIMMLGVPLLVFYPLLLPPSEEEATSRKKHISM